MKEHFNWRRNEFQQIGTDYGSIDEVAAYDARMRKMRDVDAGESDDSRCDQAEEGKRGA